MRQLLWGCVEVVVVGVGLALAAVAVRAMGPEGWISDGLFSAALFALSAVAGHLIFARRMGRHLNRRD